MQLASRLIEEARDKARETNQPVYVAEWDYEEDRKRGILTDLSCPDELDAFDTVILATIYPDGEVE